MNNKILLYILWIATFIFILGTVGAYILQFSENKISNNPEVWGQFGDYFGGILNPLLSILNLIILTYLSIRLVKEDDNRNKYTLQELARPLAEIEFRNKLDEIRIRVHNYGLGPLIINKILIEKENKSYSSFKNFLDDLSYPNNAYKIAHYTTLSFERTDDHSVIGKDGNIRLLQVRMFEGADKEEYQHLLSFLRKQLNGYKITIEYCDMYESKMPTLSDSINLNEIF